MNLLRTLAVILAVFAMAACNDSGFSGKSGKNPAAKQPQDENDDQPKKKKKKDRPGRDDGDDVGDPSDRDDEGGPDNGSLGDNSDDAKPSLDSVIDNFGGLLDDDESEIDLDGGDGDKEVVFGENELFHVGDAGNDASSCKFLEDTYTLSGDQYFFEFTVLKEDTTVNITINRVCGVDYGDTNIISLTGGDAAYEEPVAPQSALIVVPSQTLGPGKYVLSVVSRAGSKTPYPDAPPTDKDDYLIGDIRITADRPIKPGDFGTK